MVNNSTFDKFIKYVISDMTEMYDIDSNTAKQLIKIYDLESLARECPNETFHYPPEYWAEEIFKSSKIQLS